MKKEYKLELFFPLAISIILVSVLAVVVSFYVQKNSIKENKLETISLYNERFNKLVESDVNILHSLINLMLKDKELQNTYLKNDRELLYSYINDSYEKLNKYNDITHLYFIKSNGEVFLREHDLNRHSDMIKRYTFL